MDWIADIFTAAVSGGLTGLLGTVFSGLVMWKENSDKRKFELEMRRLDISERKAEAEITLKQTEAETEATKIAAELNAFQASQKGDKATYSTKHPSNGWLIAVDVVRGLIRPVLTLALVTITTMITFDAIEATGGYEKFVAVQGVNIVLSLIESLIYMTNTAVLWWFGARSLSKSVKKHA
ncbi:TMhelix containing protein [Vibrio phage vB_VhaS_R21Y]|nr:TMhelix containing protein [Vibrio phage vB_VcaS_HC]WKV32835.1 TMhelix containing protein [Vibrio phage vB_VhaS_R21Y]